MKYLVQLTPQPSAPLLDDPLSANKEIVAYVAELQKKGTLEVGYSFVAGGGVGILDVASHEELWEIIYDYPFSRTFQWRVDPLADVSQTLGKAIEMSEKEAGK